MREIDLPVLMESRRDQMEFIVEVPVSGTIGVNLYDEVYIDLNDLDTEFTALPGQISYWSVISARFSQAVATLEREYEIWYAKVYDEAFQELEKMTGRRPNISSAEYLVKKDHKDEWLSRMTTLEQAKADLAVIQSIVPSLNAKLQCLMQLAKGRSAEYNSAEPVYRGVNRFITPVSKVFTKSSDPTIDETKDLFSQMRRSKNNGV